ncbi:MAG: polymerase subunit sigma-70 [Caulobacter sp.]|nr:polymerase subunit sigma-70 [Caulobacter sp.]
MASDPPTPAPTTPGLDQAIAALRPQLFRYCARMTGSAVDGEDAVQEALLKALQAAPAPGVLRDPKAWLFRIAHNASLDLLRRRAREQARFEEADIERIADTADEAARRQAAQAGLAAFMELTAPQRGAVVLMDLLGYSLAEIAVILETTTGAVKASLHRGRARLRAVAGRPADAPPPAMTVQERRQLAGYVDRFNARDFDAVRRMLADDVRLDVVGLVTRRGRAEVETYFGNYSGLFDWRLAVGFVDGRPAAVVTRPEGGEAAYFVTVDFEDGRIVRLRDYRHAAHVVEAAAVVA